jgi:hypothetical protein
MFHLDTVGVDWGFGLGLFLHGLVDFGFGNINPGIPMVFTPWDKTSSYFAPVKLSLSIALAILAGIAFGLEAPPVLGQAEPLTPSPIFTLDLRSYGWEPPWERQHEINMPSIVVDHKGRVVLGFTAQARSGLVTRNQPSLDFRIMRFSPDGRVDSSLSLPTHEKGINSVYLSDTDQIIARANDSLQFLQADDGNLQKGAWKTLCARSCGVMQSPTRRTLVLTVKGADSPLTIVRFSEQLALRRCGSFNYTQYITDEFAYYHNWEPESGYFTHRWPLCQYERRVDVPLPARGRWAVLNDDTFVVYSNDKKDEGMEVVSLDGHVKFRPTMQKHELASPTIKTSERGNVIAADLVTIKGRNDTLDIAGHVTSHRIAVYEVEVGKQLASIPVAPQSRHFEFDLSPDGHRLAILEDDLVKVFNVEGAATPQDNNSIEHGR